MFSLCMKIIVCHIILVIAQIVDKFKKSCSKKSLTSCLVSRNEKLNLQNRNNLVIKRC